MNTGTAKAKLDLIAMGLLLGLCASWGLNQVAIKVGNNGISPLLQGGIRSVGATLLVWAWMVWRGQPVWQKDRSLWPGVIVGSMFSIEFILIYWGLTFTAVSRSVVFLYMMPFVVAIGAKLFIPGESMKPYQIVGLCCSFCGIVVAFNESIRLPTPRMLIGDIMLLVAAVIWGASTIVVKITPLAGIRPGKTLLYQLAASAVVLPIGSLAMGEPGVCQNHPVNCRQPHLSDGLGGCHHLSGLVLAYPKLSRPAVGFIFFLHPLVRRVGRWNAAPRTHDALFIDCSWVGGAGYIFGQSTEKAIKRRKLNCQEKTMNVIAINGGPRKKWNTAMMLEKALEGAASKGAGTELIHLYDLEYKGCISCFACKKRGGDNYGRCGVKDDLTAVFAEIEKADALILGSPIYFGDVTGALRSFLERLLFQYHVYTMPRQSLFSKKIKPASSTP